MDKQFPFFYFILVNLYFLQKETLEDDFMLKDTFQGGF